VEPGKGEKRKRKGRAQAVVDADRPKELLYGDGERPQKGKRKGGRDRLAKRSEDCIHRLDRGDVGKKARSMTYYVVQKNQKREKGEREEG